MIKMIVSDLDGTLLTLDKKVPPKTKEILKNKKLQNKQIVIASGRTLESARYAMNDFSYVNYIITNNGAAIYDIEKEELIYHEYFKIEQAIEIFNKYKDKILSINICSFKYYYQYNTLKENTLNPAVIKVENYKDIIQRNLPVCNLDINIINQEEIPIIIREINRTFHNLKAVIMQDSFSENKWINVTKKGIHKSKTLSLLQKKLKISKKETIIFGDGLNDTEMLKKNGTGIAMENALPEIKKVAKYITSSHEEEGVRKWLENNIV